MPDNDILSVAEVAAQFDVTAQTIRSWIHTGKLKASRVGKAHRILRGDVYAMLESASVEPRSGRNLDVWEHDASELPAVLGRERPPGDAGEPAPMWASEGATSMLVPGKPG